MLLHIILSGVFTDFAVPFSMRNHSMTQFNSISVCGFKSRIEMLESFSVKNSSSERQLISVRGFKSTD